MPSRRWIESSRRASQVTGISIGWTGGLRRARRPPWRRRIVSSGRFGRRRRRTKNTYNIKYDANPGDNHICTRTTMSTLDSTLFMGGGRLHGPRDGWFPPGEGVYHDRGGKNNITTATKRRLPWHKTHPHARDVTDHRSDGLQR